VVLAAVYVPGRDAAINANQITDKRCQLSPLAIAAPGCVRAVLGLDERPSRLHGRDVGGTGASVTNTTGDQDQVGAVTFGTGTTAAGCGWLHCHAAAMRFGNGEAILRAVVTTEANLSSAAQRYDLTVGFGDMNRGAKTDGAYFRYADDVNGGKWQCETSSNSARTWPTRVAVAASTRYLSRSKWRAMAVRSRSTSTATRSRRS
jgi:hypothetical protein